MQTYYCEITSDERRRNPLNDITIKISKQICQQYFILSSKSTLILLKTPGSKYIFNISDTQFIFLTKEMWYLTVQNQKPQNEI